MLCIVRVALVVSTDLLTPSLIRRSDPTAEKVVRECTATMIRDHFLVSVRSVKQVFIMEDGTIRGTGMLIGVCDA